MVVRMECLPADLASQTLLEFVDKITHHPDAVQERVLSAILQQNEGCEYLSRHGLGGGVKIEKDGFKSRLPVIEYEDIKGDIERIADGDRSPLLTGPPVTELFTSSGTSGGARKLFPNVARDGFRKVVHDAIAIATLDRAVPALRNGKALYLFTIRSTSTTKGGLVAQTTLTKTFKDIFAPGAKNAYKDIVTSPGAVFLCPEDKNQIIYCHLLCGLLQRREIVRVRAIFASFLVRALRYLLKAWPLMCHDIRHGKLNPIVTDPDVRAAVEKLLHPNPALADEIEAIMSSQSPPCKNLVPRLFPKALIVEAITTGAMAAYVPLLEHFAGELPIVCMPYGASEGYFGLNLDALCHPSKVSYTIMPFVNYFEFIPLRRDPSTGQVRAAVEDIVDLVDVVLGQDYELVITNFSGLYRFRVGDIVRPCGYHNASPKFEMIGRKNVLLSIDTDKTDEHTLLTAITASLGTLFSQLRQEHNIESHLLDYSSFPDVSQSPGRYVLYLEMANLPEKEQELEEEAGSEKSLQKHLELFCLNVEQRLCSIYRRNRNEGVIGPLEVRVVKPGSFEQVAQAAVSRGADIGQYKTPRCLKILSDVEILNSNLLLPSACSQALPSL